MWSSSTVGIVIAPVSGMSKLLMNVAPPCLGVNPFRESTVSMALAFRGRWPDLGMINDRGGPWAVPLKVGRGPAILSLRVALAFEVGFAPLSFE